MLYLEGIEKNMVPDPCTDIVSSDTKKLSKLKRGKGKGFEFGLVKTSFRKRCSGYLCWVSAYGGK